MRVRMRRDTSLAERFLLIALIASAYAFLAPSPASATRVPTITRGIAEEFTYRNLRELPGWRYRSAGYVDCDRGRLSRTEWACRVGWIYGRGCRYGRVRVYGTRVDYAGRKFYASHAVWKVGC